MSGAEEQTSDRARGVGDTSGADESPAGELVRIVSFDPSLVSTLVDLVESHGAIAQVVASQEAL